MSNEPEDFRSDIYSFGATLFHAIASKAPIEGDTNSAVVLLNLKKQLLDLRTIAPEISQATASVFQRMIASGPAQRFSCDDLVSELEQAQRALTGMNHIDVAPRRRQRWVFISAALLVMLTVAPAVYFLAGKPRHNVPAIASSASSVPFSRREEDLTPPASETS